MASALVSAIREAGGEVAAVASRTDETAGAFAADHGLPRWFGSYEGLIGEADVDAVYVSTTNQRHHDDTLLCLEAGLAVLCEKPLALNARQASVMVDVARSSGVFLMEAMWMVFQPAFLTMNRLIKGGVIGPVSHVQADFGFPADLKPAGRLADPALGGGALLDIGIYPLTLVHSLLGSPDGFEASAILGPTGPDVQVGVVSTHGDALATVSASFLADSSIEAVVSGPEGRLCLHAPFHHSPLVTLHRRGDLIDSWDCSYEGSGYGSEVDEVHRCLDAGLVESDRRSLADTLEVLQWMDAIRSRIGVAYASE
jgi:predicted dehydrogenase